MSDFPILTAGDRACYPRDRSCPVCGSEFLDGVAYLSAGALLLSDEGKDSIQSDRLQAFLHLGFHGIDTEMRDSADIPVVRDLHGGQFDLQWCSIKCMRNGLLELLNELEAMLGGQADNQSRQS